MLKRLLLLLLLYAVATGLRPAEGYVVSGRVYGANDGAPLEDVTVSVLAAHIYTQTNAQGAFRIKVPVGKNILRFSFIGYATKSIIIGKLHSINVCLEFVAQPPATRDLQRKNQL